MPLDELHDSYASRLKPSEVEVTSVFGLLLNGLRADGLIEVIRNSPPYTHHIGYRLTQRGIDLISSIRDIAKANEAAGIPDVEE